MKMMERISRKKKKLHIGDSGFSLVELIIVIAIMSALMTTAMLSISMIFSANAKACANGIQRAVADCKVTTMGKSAAWLVLYRDADGVLYGQMHTMEQKSGEAIGTFEEVIQEPEKLGGKRVSITYTDDSGTDMGELPVGESNGIRIEFDRSSGSFKDGTIKSIDITGGNKHYRLTLIKLTGKLSMKLL